MLLTGASPEWMKWVGNKDSVVKTALRKRGIEVLEFLGTVLGNSVDVCKQDFEVCLPSADLVIAFPDHPATGVGMEIATEMWRYQKCGAILLPRGHQGVSRAVLGTAELYSNRMTLREYDPGDGAAESIAQHVEMLLNAQREISPHLVSSSEDEIVVHQQALLNNIRVYSNLARRGNTIKIHNHRSQFVCRLPKDQWKEGEEAALRNVAELVAKHTSSLLMKAQEVFC